MTVNYLMASSDGGQLPHGFWWWRSITSWLLVMTVNYLMDSSDDGQLPHDSSDDGQLPHGF